MTFENWWATLTTREKARMVRDDVAEAWAAATAAEREACAALCDAEAQGWRDSDAEGSESLAYEDKALESAARAIRMRSNVELTGAARPDRAASRERSERGRP